MSEVVKQIGGEFGVTVRFTVGEASVRFFAAEVTGVTPDGKPIYWRKGEASNASNPAITIDDAERYVDGFVKWDGCAHYYFGDENGYLHLCDATEIKKLNNVVLEIHRTCGQLMKESGQNVEEDEFDLVLNSSP